mgnify:CR=1 FL=1
MSSFDYGYNPNLVKSSIGKVNESFKMFTDAACKGMQNSFVNQMANYWAAPEAVEEFAKMKASNDSLTQSAEKTFQSVVDVMNTGSRNWAQSTKSDAITVGFESTRTDIDVSCIKDNLGGDIGAESGGAFSTANNLMKISSNVGTALDNAVNAVSTCGFINSGESSALIGSLNKIKQNYTEAMTKNYNSMKTAIEQTIDKYKSTSGANTGNFTA